MRATYAVTDSLNVMVGVNNGWNSTNTDFGSKTGELGATLAIGKMFSFAATGYFGKIADGEDLSLIDFVGTYNVTSQLSLVLNADAYQLSGENSGHVHINALRPTPITQSATRCAYRSVPSIWTMWVPAMPSKAR